jgi:hypothetical protein
MKTRLAIAGAFACAMVACAPLPRAPIDVAGESGPHVHVAHEVYPQQEGEQKQEAPRLERLSPDGVFRPVCAAPCNKVLDPSHQYRIGGETIVPSDPFRLPNARAVDLDVKPGSVAAKPLGATFFVMGLLTLGVGIAAAGFGLGSDSAGGRAFGIAGGTIFGLTGLLFGGLGVYALVDHTDTRVDVRARP